MKEKKIIVCYSNIEKKYPNNIHNSTPCPSIFNKNNSIFIINDKMKKIKFGENRSFSQINKNNKEIIFKFIEKDNSGVSSQSIFDKFKEEYLEDNEFLFYINSLIEEGDFEKKSLEQESISSSKFSNIVYIIKKDDVINNQLSYNKNKNEEYTKELEKKIETLIKEKENILNLNKKLTEEVECLKKEKNMLYNTIDSLKIANDILKKYVDLKEENKQLKEGKLFEENKKELNDKDDFKKNENLVNKNENKDQYDFEIQKQINEMRKEYKLDETYSDKKLYEFLKENDYDKELAFSKLFD